jgi:hypothetical protein
MFFRIYSISTNANFCAEADVKPQIAQMIQIISFFIIALFYVIHLYDV